MSRNIIGIMITILIIALLFTLTACKKNTHDVYMPTAVENTNEPLLNDGSVDSSEEQKQKSSQKPTYYPGMGEITPDILEETNVDKPIFEDNYDIPPELEEYDSSGEHSIVLTDEWESDVLKFLGENTAESNESIAEKTYVYSEEQLYNSYFPNCDYGEWWGNSFNKLYMMDMFMYRPTKAIRENNDSSFCLIYDTDTNMRVFVWYTVGTGEWYEQFGYPIYMAETLSYSDFEGVEIGDDVSEVEAIDPKVTEIHMRYDREEQEPQYTQNSIKNGYPPRSLHLLTDGLLVITYGRDGDNFPITDIEFHEDFTIDTVAGPQCCKINPLDYVTQG